MTELAEGARLEIVCSAKSGTEGSNPSLSAKKFLWTQINADFQDMELKKSQQGKRQRDFSKGFALSALICVNLRPNKLYDSRVLRNGTLPIPSGPEGSSGRNTFRVPQGSLAITPKICGANFTRNDKLLTCNANKKFFRIPKCPT
jgi:hypothetical protein